MTNLCFVFIVLSTLFSSIFSQAVEFKKECTKKVSKQMYSPPRTNWGRGTYSIYSVQLSYNVDCLDGNNLVTVPRFNDYRYYATEIKENEFRPSSRRRKSGGGLYTNRRAPRNTSLEYRSLKSALSTCRKDMERLKDMTCGHTPQCSDI